MLSAGGPPEHASAERGGYSVIAPKLTRNWWRCFLRLPPLSGFGRPLPVAAICWNSRTTLLPLLLLLLRRLVLLWRRLLTASGLRPFSSGARFIRVYSTSGRRDRLPHSSCRTGCTLLTFSCPHRCWRAEPYTFIATLRRSLSCPTGRLVRLLTWPSHWRATMLLLLRRCTFQSWSGR
jgi:hypothetical protein